jgi:excisionase family DNA binding protein
MQTKSELPRRLLRTSEAARYLGVSKWKVRELVQSGELPYIQINGGPWLFDVRDLDAFIERHKQFTTC